jgi:EpsI family protein
MIKLPTVPFRSALLIAVTLLVAVGGAIALTPHLSYVDSPPSLDATVPKRFGDWVEVPSPYVQVDLSVRREGDLSTDQPYDETVMRTYRNAKGQQVMLALAYGKRQRQEVKVHRPDLCYVAQGYRVDSLVPTQFDVRRGAGAKIDGKRMIANNRGRTEAVAYWIRIGHLYSESAWETRGHILREGLQGRVPDGILVRASAPLGGPAEAAAVFPVLEAFLVDLVSAMPADASSLLVR